MTSLAQTPPAVQPRPQDMWFHRGAGRGHRRPSPAARLATARADSFRGLPDGVSRWRLAAALRAAAKPMGLTSAMLRLLELYIDLTYDVDWTEGSDPVVCRPLVEIAEHLGRSERQVRNLERALVDKGLLAWRDSGNHHRKGRRDHRTGRLIYAYGPSLAPLGAQCDAIIALAAKHRRDVADIRRCRIAIAALRRRIRTGLAALHPDATAHLVAQLATIPPRHTAGTPLSELEAHRTTLHTLAHDIDLLNNADLAVECASEAEILATTYDRNINVESINGVSNDSQKKSAIKMFNSGQHGHDDIITNTQEYAKIIGVNHNMWSNACVSIGRYQTALIIIYMNIKLDKVNYQKHREVENPIAYFRFLVQNVQNGKIDIRKIYNIVQKNTYTKVNAHHSPRYSDMIYNQQYESPYP